jgi:hypothetical protein
LLANGIDPQVHNNDKANALKMLLNTHFKQWQEMVDEKVKTSGISQDHAKTSGEA